MNCRDARDGIAHRALQNHRVEFYRVHVTGAMAQSGCHIIARARSENEHILRVRHQSVGNFVVGNQEAIRACFRILSQEPRREVRGPLMTHGRAVTY